MIQMVHSTTQNSQESIRDSIYGTMISSQTLNPLDGIPIVSHKYGGTAMFNRRHLRTQSWWIIQNGGRWAKWLGTGRVHRDTENIEVPSVSGPCYRHLVGVVV